MKRPAFQFYPSDWRKDVRLRSVSVAARGLWIDLMCVMHEGEPYGHLAVAHKPLTMRQVAGLLGMHPAQYSRLLKELEDSGVASRTPEGIIYSRRMVRDEEIRLERVLAGTAGRRSAQDPKASRYVYALRRPADGAVKIGCSRNPEHRRLALQRDGSPLEMIAYGAGGYDVEARAHIQLADERIEGEWFRDTPSVRAWISDNLQIVPPEPTSGAAAGLTTGKTSGRLYAAAAADAVVVAVPEGGAGGNRAEAELLDRFPEEYRPDVVNQIRAAHSPAALIQELKWLLDGHDPSCRGAGPEHVGRALRDLAMAGRKATGATLRGFVRGAMRAPVQRPAASSGSANAFRALAEELSGQGGSHA